MPLCPPVTTSLSSGHIQLSWDLKCDIVVLYCNKLCMYRRDYCTVVVCIRFIGVAASDATGRPTSGCATLLSGGLVCQLLRFCFLDSEDTSYHISRPGFNFWLQASNFNQSSSFVSADLNMVPGNMNNRQGRLAKI
jgi:hypothetical protein